ncbi:MAG: energy transducer TonB [Pseudomonadota bacterium]
MAFAALNVPAQEARGHAGARLDLRALGLAVLAHGAVIAAVTHEAPVEQAAPVEAITVSLISASAPAPVEPAPESVPPAPVAPPPPPVPVKALEPAPVLAVQENRPAEKPVSKPVPPKPEPVKAKPKPKPVTPPPEPPPVTPTEPVEEAPPPLETPPAPVATPAPAAESREADSTPAVAPQRTASPDETRRYLAALMRQLNRYKTYPSALKKERIEGKVIVQFTLDAEGQLISARVQESSGHDGLDQAALDMLQRAAPLPAIPDFMRKDRLTLSIPVDYSLITER